MNILKRSEIEALIQRRNGWHVSIFMPTHRLGDDILQDPVRFKNLTSEAEGQLIDLGMRQPDAQKIINPLYELATIRDFWRHQSDGLAVFISPTVFQYQRLPMNFDERVVVSDRFHIKPLLPLLSWDGRFYILTLSQQEIKLLQGTRFSVGEVDLHEIPEGLQEALRWEDPERRLQWHTSSSNEPGMRRAEFHGHMANAEVETKELIKRYFHEIDKGLNQILGEDHAPLVLAGVDYLLPIYKEVNSYPMLEERGVPGSPKELDMASLHEKAWPIVQPHFQRDREEAADLYRQLSGQSDPRASDEIREIVPAAVFEQVDTFFFPKNLNQWGNFDPESNEVTLDDEYESGDEDLIDLAAAHTILNNGTVYAVEEDQVPGDANLAAIFRY
jgi:hypothetical protein